MSPSLRAHAYITLGSVLAGLEGRVLSPSLRAHAYITLGMCVLAGLEGRVLYCLPHSGLMLMSISLWVCVYVCPGWARGAGIVSLTQGSCLYHSG